MQALITGASGLLGWWLGRALHEQEWTVFGGFRSPPKAQEAKKLWPWGETVPLDLTIPASVEQAIDSAAPDLIFHLGALNDIDRCEDDPQLARLINTLGCRWVGKAAAARGARVCFLSTDQVFDGQEAPYSEYSPTNALHSFGQTKKAGEAALALAHPDPLIIRAAHFGLHPRRATTLSHLINQLRSGQSVWMRADTWSTPLCSLTLAEALAELGGEPGGTRHLPGKAVSQYDWAVAVANAIKVDPNLVQPLGLEPPRAENPLSAGRLSRPATPRWHGGRTTYGRAPLPLDTRLRTLYKWEPPPLAEELKRMLEAFEADVTP